jgi:hypothetical protein
MGAGLLEEGISTTDYALWIEKHKPKARAKPDAASGQQQAVTLQLF